MGTIADKLNYLEETKQSIRTAIENKGVTISDTDSFRSYGDKINDIQNVNYNFEIDENLPIVDKGYSDNYISQIITKITKIPEKRLTNNNWANMFKGFTNLKEIPLDLDSSHVTNMSSLFEECNNLETFPELNSSNANYMNTMFKGCKKLAEVPQLNTSKNISIANMFSGCNNITYIPLLDCGKVSSCGQALYFSVPLTQEVTIEGFKDLGKAYTQKSKGYYGYKLELYRIPNLTHDSLMNIINNLYDLNLTYDVANGGTLYEQGLSIGATNIAKLTEEEIAIATNKGWIVS